jgi:hypothetical protein
MMLRRSALPILATTLFLGGVPAHADTVKCQKEVARSLARFTRIYLKAQEKCLDLENIGKLPGPCPDPVGVLKIQGAADKATLKIGAVCALADVAALGFRADCAYEPAVSGAEGTCAGLPVTTPAEFAQCLRCWKQAEVAEFTGLLYASRVQEVCGGTLDEGSPVCSDLDCTTPLPDQRKLGDTAEGDCQKAIGKGGIKYFTSRLKVLEKCALAGLTQTGCLADAKVQIALAKMELKKQAVIQKKCASRDPAPSPPFCCKTMGNSCLPAVDRTDCEVVVGGQVQDDKTCVAGSCSPLGGNKKITWWGFCPESATCPGTALTTLADLIGCVDTSADAIVDELVCLQFHGNGGADWPCPPSDGSPSGAFVDGSR